MATPLKPFNSVGGFTVSSSLLPSIDANNNANFAGLTLAGNMDLGPIANVHITGGTAAQTIVTDGAGNLVFADVTAVTLGDANANVKLGAGNTVLIAAGATANVVIVTGTGANITGTANVSGDTDVGGNVNLVNDGAIHWNYGSYAQENTISHALDVVAGTDLNLTASGGSNISATGAFLNVTGNANVSGTANIVGNLEAGNLTTLGTTSTGALTATGNVQLGTVANVHIDGGAAGQYLATNGSGALSWVTLDTDTLANGTSNVSIDVADGNVTIGVAGNAAIATFTGTGANIAGTANVTGDLAVGGNANVTGNVSFVGGNASTLDATSGITTANLTANGNVQLGDIGNVHIDGGALGQVLITDGSGALSWATASAIANTTSNIAIDTAGGNITMGVDGVANVLVVTSSGLDIVGAGGANLEFSTAGNIFTANADTLDLYTNSKTGADYVQVALNHASNVEITAAGGTKIWSFNADGTTQFPGFALTATGPTGGQVLTYVSANSAAEWASVDTSLIANGTSSVSIPVADGNVAVTVGGSNVVVATTTGAELTGTLTFTGSTANITTSGDSIVLNVGSTTADGVQITGSGRILGTDGNVVAIAAAGGVFESSASLKVGTVTANSALTLVGGSGNVSLYAGSATADYSLLFPTTVPAITGQALVADTSGQLSWANIAVDHIANGSSNVAVDGLNGNVLTSANGQANIISVSSTGTHATTVISDDVTITGNLVIGGSYVSVNVTELNVKDPIITEGRGANNAPLTAVDGLDRGLYSYYFDTAEKGAFVGYKTSGTDAGSYIIASDATLLNDVVTVVTYADVKANTFTGNLTNGSSSVGFTAANGDIAVAVAGANVVVATSAGAAVTGNITATGNLVVNTTTVGAATLTTTATATTGVVSVAAVAGTAVEFLVTSKDATNGFYETCKVLALTDGTTVDYTSYGTVRIGGTTGIVSAAYATGTIVLNVDAASTASTVWTVQYRIVG